MGKNFHLSYNTIGNEVQNKKMAKIGPAKLLAKKWDWQFWERKTWGYLHLVSLFYFYKLMVLFANLWKYVLIVVGISPYVFSKMNTGDIAPADV